MNWTLFLKLIFVFLFLKCIYIQNQSLDNIHYPETPFLSGFMPGRPELKKEYAQDWCKKFCNRIDSILKKSPDGYYLEISGKMDATEIPPNREKLSLDRADSVRQLLSDYGIPKDRMKAIADPDPNEFIGRDLFDPENRVVRFQIRKKN